MSKKISKYVRSEESASCHINVVAHYDDVTLLDKSDRLIQIIRLNGLDCVSRDNESLDGYKNRINNLLKRFSSEFAWYSWEIRRRAVDYPSGEFPKGFSRDLNNHYRAHIENSQLFQNDLYLAIIAKQPEGLINQGFSFLHQFNQKLDKQHRSIQLATKHTELHAMTQKVMSAMSDYGCELLSAYEEGGIKFSAPLEFVSKLINFDDNRIQLPLSDASKIIPSKRLFFNNHAGIVELRSANGASRFAAMLSIKGYSPRTSQGILSEISKVKSDFVITQSFRFLDKHNAKGKLRDQKKEMQQTRDESISQTLQLDEAFDEAASGEVGFGLHHFTMAIYSNDIEELNKNVSLICSRFADCDITCVREDVVSECAFWSQLPGNFGYALRAVPISTRNMAGLASFHNYYRGKLTGNHWGGAVTVLETIAGTPYYFNFHHKDVGNFLIYGSMGSGKTLLTGFLVSESMKFGGKRVFFDKDRGLEAYIRAMRGTYERIKPGVAAGFNPCQLSDTPENRAFLISLITKILTVNGERLTEADSEVIVSAIDGLYRLDQSSRQLCHIASFFGSRKSGSLRNRFDQWHSEGQHAWLFDNETDSLNLNADILGFDLGNILNDAACKTPAIMYLMYRVQDAMAGQNGMIIFDEGWLVLNDPILRDYLNDFGRTLRKKNIIFGLITQSANDTVDSAISKAINDSAHCKIFFPNPSADRHVYVDALGLTEHQYQIVKKLQDDQHYFLLVHGHGVNQECVIARPDLSKLEDEIAVISGRESSISVLDELRKSVGNDPDVWLPFYYERMRGVR